METKKKIVVAICTYKRPNMLSRCLESVLSADFDVSGYTVEFLAVDNSPECEGQEVVARYGGRVNYATESKKGYASARNCALKKALELGADFISFVDDDEFVDKNWLKELVLAMEKFEADVVSSSPIQVFEDESTPSYIKNNFIFNKKNKKKTGRKRTTSGTDNVLFSADLVRRSELYFDESSNNMIGEDILFFSRANDLGYKIIWCNESIVYESIPKERASLEWVLKRHFMNGYFNGLNEPRGLGEIIFNIALFALLLPFSRLLGKTAFYNTLSKFYRKNGEIAGLVLKEPLVYHRNALGG
ncbi:glycosyl transferase family 2 [Candidatus Gastranaerophilus sp. (ex Termes propinquus)]|nr:glycosyl transferase family 2 [Candidatus Gastranaerophilus sp. (ex Termes propinquus)]